MEGSLQGQVLFAQNVIIPSKTATDPEDHRPHLVSLRDTLILFRPISSINPEIGVAVSISDKNDQQVFNGDMSPPDEMPRIAEQVTDDIDEYDFIEPDSYDFIFSNQSMLNLINDGPDGNYLLDLLVTNRFVKIETANGQWIEKFYLPPLDVRHDNILIVFDIQSAWGCSVNYNDNEIELTTGTKIAFTNIKGAWDTIYDSSYKENTAVKELISNKIYSETIKGQNQLNMMAQDYEGNLINELLNQGNVNIKTANGAWIRDFWLPKNNAKNENEGKIVTFTSNAGYHSNIFYDYGTSTLSNGDNLIFLCRNGKWVEYSDVFFGKIKYGVGYWSLKIPKESVIPEISFSFHIIT